ncbi:phage tail protein [Bartonella raoultii]|uniref:Phage tail protein n=1 Tax=Bartonella raoultii TaxID=1457020 RepID=A0ABS7I6I9_9HYPH|nr:phage tail protein [Bartonella raoultii]MBX4336509.1 phage tail protein [Bartonella raoultii]
MSTIYDWSHQASENTHADALINWAEGQAPSTVNNSARVMMQRMKEYLLDTGGALEGIVEVDATQQKTEIRLETHCQFLEYRNGIHLRFLSRGQNVGSTSVSLNGLGSKTVYKATALGAVPLTGGEIQRDCLYSLVFREDAWHLLNPTPVVQRESTDISLYPSGFIGTFAMRNIPDGWLICDGKAYSRITYRSLFEAIGTAWGAGDGFSTFHVPDLRGVFLRGLDSGRNIDAQRDFASIQKDLMHAHQHKGQTLSTEHLLDKEHYWDGNTTDILGYKLRLFEGGVLANFTGVESEYIDGYLIEPYSVDHSPDVNLERTGEGETRPINMSVLFCIKT